MSEPKPVIEGPKKGQTRTICMQCGHTNYLGVSFQAQVQQQQTQVQQPSQGAKTPEKWQWSF
jgi:hypothetical protein